MKSIKEQMEALKINVEPVQNKTDKTNSVTSFKNENPLPQDLIDEILLIVVSNLPAHKCNSKVSDVFIKNQLKIKIIIKKRLKNIILKAKKDSFLDTLAFTNFLASIDADKARLFFSNNAAAKASQVKKKNKKPKQDKKAQLKPLAPSNLPKPSAKEILQESRGIKVIGLGIESIVNIPRVKSADVQIDKNTSNDKITDKSILYAAGWSIDGPFSKD